MILAKKRWQELQTSQQWTTLSAKPNPVSDPVNQLIEQENTSDENLLVKMLRNCHVDYGEDDSDAKSVEKAEG